ncbi:Ig-like domain-containing protein, partial [Candidatus Dojkabacteria bacterium]|nr:Ig-like domain-containing protein [Candidatus Dojkabacteria bacterium]
MEKKKRSNKRISFEGFEKQIGSLRELLSAVRNKEEIRSMASLDKKLVDRLVENNESELAASISDLSTAMNPKQGSFPGFLDYPWLKPAGLWTIAIIGLSAVFVYFTGTWNISVQKPSDLEKENNAVATLLPQESAPAILIPQNVANSGYISSENQFQIKVHGEIEGDPSDLVTIEPKTDFDIEVTAVGDDSVIIVTPKSKLKSDTEYKIALNQDSGTATPPLTWNLKVEPKLEVLSVTPSENSEENKLDSIIEVEFNRSDIDLPDFEKAVSLSPEVAGSWIKSAASFVFVPSEKLKFDSLYTLNIDKSLTDKHGNPLSKGFTSSFMTTSAPKEISPIEITWSDGLNFLNTDTGSISQKVTLSGETDKIEFNLYQIDKEGLFESLQMSLDRE